MLIENYFLSNIEYLIQLNSEMKAVYSELKDHQLVTTTDLARKRLVKIVLINFFIFIYSKEKPPS
jgi:hypothetical protein